MTKGHVSATRTFINLANTDKKIHLVGVDPFYRYDDGISDGDFDSGGVDIDGVVCRLPLLQKTYEYCHYIYILLMLRREITPWFCHMVNGPWRIIGNSTQ